MHIDIQFEIISVVFAGGGYLGHLLYFETWENKVLGMIKSLEDVISQSIEFEYNKLYGYFKEKVKQTFLLVREGEALLEFENAFGADSELKIEKSAVRKIRSANKYLDKLNSYLKRIPYYRRFFLFFLAASLILLLLKFVFSEQDLELYSKIVLTCTLVFVVVVAVDLAEFATFRSKVIKGHDLQ